MNLLSFVMVGLGLLVGATFGVVLYAWWVHQKAAASVHLPVKWPLASRAMITKEEHEVLRWLGATFHDHLVMVKLPVLRFTIPTGKEKNAAWPRLQELLNGVYCTFTVCTTNGNVVGCVDVPSKRGLSKASREMKESLLSDCHIPYTVVRSLNLPQGVAMRTAFLGELEIKDQYEHQPTRGGDSNFHTDLDSFTQQKKQVAKVAALNEINKNEEGQVLPKSPSNGFSADGKAAFLTQKPKRFLVQWEDSRIQSEEGRPATPN